MMLLSHFPLTFHHIHNEIPLIHCMAYDYSHADLDGLFHERDVPWKDISKPSASTAAGEFCEWV